MSIEQEIMNNSPQFGYLIPFLKSTLESGLAYDFIKVIWNKIPIINRMVPAKNIAVPCLEGIVLNTDNEMLQNCFIAILEKAMDDRETDSQHPSFPKILAQLSVDEIIVLYKFNYEKVRIPLPYPDVRRKQHLKKLDFLKCLSDSMNLRMHCRHLDSLSLVETSKEINADPFFSTYVTEFGEKFLKACLNEKSESLLKGIFSHK